MKMEMVKQRGWVVLFSRQNHVPEEERVCERRERHVHHVFEANSLKSLFFIIIKREMLTGAFGALVKKLKKGIFFFGNCVFYFFKS